MRRCAVIILLLWWVSLSSGLVARAHDIQHASEDAAEIANAKSKGKPLPAQQHHDESNCQVHAQLMAPATAGDWIPFLVMLGLWIAFLTQIPRTPVAQPVFDHIRSRGPPK